jgi:hypothetical protein
VVWWLVILMPIISGSYYKYTVSEPVVPPVEVNIGDMKYLRKMKGIGPACSVDEREHT